MIPNCLRWVVLSGLVCGMLATPVRMAAQAPQSNAADANAPTTAQGQEAALKNEEKANKERSKAAKAQRKALQAQEKAAKAEKKAGEQPSAVVPAPQTGTTPK